VSMQEHAYLCDVTEMGRVHIETSRDHSSQ
jgi:hypothetical protein